MTKRAVITGAGRGIGAAIADCLASAGYAVCLVGRDASSVEIESERLRQNGWEATSLACDVAVWSDVERAAQDAEAGLGSIDVLVNNAGGWIGDPIETIDPDRLMSLTSTILLGTMYWSKAVVPAMRRAGGGFILNIGSTSGLPSTRDTAASSAPKAAVASFTQTFAREVAASGIRVGVLHPARVRKGVDRAAAEGPDDSGIYRSVSPEQVADAALWMIGQPANVLVSEVVLGPSGSPP